MSGIENIMEEIITKTPNLSRGINIGTRNCTDSEEKPKETMSRCIIILKTFKK